MTPFRRYFNLALLLAGFVAAVYVIQQGVTPTTFHLYFKKVFTNPCYPGFIWYFITAIGCIKVINNFIDNDWSDIIKNLVIPLLRLSGSAILLNSSLLIIKGAYLQIWHNILYFNEFELTDISFFIIAGLITGSFAATEISNMVKSFYQKTDPQAPHLRNQEQTTSL